MRGSWKSATLPSGESATDWILKNHLGAGGSHSHRTCADYLSANLGQRVTIPMVRSVWVTNGRVSPPAVALAGRPVAEPIGLMVEDYHDKPTGDIWQRALQAERKAKQEFAKQDRQELPLPDEPCALVFLSDLHFGNRFTEYEQARRDAELVRDTEGFYAVVHGDGVDNWLPSKLQHLERHNPIRHNEAWLLFEDWMRIMDRKLFCAVSGNHEAWNVQANGSDRFLEALPHGKIIYDMDECVFDVTCGPARKRAIVRHKWKWNSVLNPTHGQEVGWARGDVDYDIAVGGHTHIGTFFRDFYAHNERRMAILTGAYKWRDRHGRACGFNRTKWRGCGALIITPDGDMEGFRNLELARDVLGMLRNRWA